MDIRYLQWDSDFFGLRIGRATILSLEEAAELRAQQAELKQQFDLLYVFDENNVGFAAGGASLVDEKVLYAKDCQPRQSFSSISLYPNSKPSDDLYRLALVSGLYSRFRLDSRFPIGSYERLYQRWIDSACPQAGTNKQILVYLDADGECRGMITVDYQDSLAHIGLVAVDMHHQHQGKGTQIMSSLDHYLFSQGVKRIEVATQKQNRDACAWYEKNGFMIQSITNIYHWWL